MTTNYPYSPSTIDQASFSESPCNSDDSDNSFFRKVLVQGKTNYLCLAQGCEKLFKFKSEIDRHLKVHSVTRPFTCEYPNCNKSFKRADALNSHLRIHTSSVTFNCPVESCTSHFTTKSALNFHLQKHNGKNVKKETKNDNRKRVPLSNQQIQEFEHVQKRVMINNHVNARYVDYSCNMDASMYAKLGANVQNLNSTHIGNLRYEHIDSNRSDITTTDISKELYVERELEFENMAMFENVFEKEYTPIENLYRADLYNHLYVEKHGGEDADVFFGLPTFH